MNNYGFTVVEICDGIPKSAVFKANKQDAIDFAMVLAGSIFKEIDRDHFEEQGYVTNGVWTVAVVETDLE